MELWVAIIMLLYNRYATIYIVCFMLLFVDCCGLFLLLFVYCYGLLRARVATPQSHHTHHLQNIGQTMDMKLGAPCKPTMDMQLGNAN